MIHNLPIQRKYGLIRKILTEREVILIGADSNGIWYSVNGRSYPCPIELAVSVLAGRWKTTILCELLSGKKRYGELKRNIPKVNHKMLAEQLRELEEAGVIARQVYPVVPPKVEYELTPLGENLRPAVEHLRTWGQSFAEQPNSSAEQTTP